MLFSNHIEFLSADSAPAASSDMVDSAESATTPAEKVAGSDSVDGAAPAASSDMVDSAESAPAASSDMVDSAESAPAARSDMVDSAESATTPAEKVAGSDSVDGAAPAASSDMVDSAESAPAVLDLIPRHVLLLGRWIPRQNTYVPREELMR